MNSSAWATLQLEPSNLRPPCVSAHELRCRLLPGSSTDKSSVQLPWSDSAPPVREPLCAPSSNGGRGSPSTVLRRDPASQHRSCFSLTTSRRLADRKTAKFHKNISRRGSVVKRGNDYPVGTILLGFLAFVVIGSSLFQIIRTATSGGMA